MNPAFESSSARDYIRKRFYTLSEAVDLSGRNEFGDDWVDVENLFEFDISSDTQPFPEEILQLVHKSALSNVVTLPNGHQRSTIETPAIEELVGIWQGTNPTKAYYSPLFSNRDETPRDRLDVLRTPVWLESMELCDRAAAVVAGEESESSFILTDSQRTYLLQNWADYVPRQRGFSAASRVRDAIVDGDLTARVFDIASGKMQNVPPSALVATTMQISFIESAISSDEPWIPSNNVILLEKSPFDDWLAATALPIGVRGGELTAAARGPKRESTRLKWCPIHERGVRLHKEIHHSGGPDDEVYLRLLEEIKDSESALSKALTDIDGEPKTKDAISRGLSRHFGQHWWEAPVAPT